MRLAKTAERCQQLAFESLENDNRTRKINNGYSQLTIFHKPEFAICQVSCIRSLP